jgi:uncharacterized protein
MISALLFGAIVGVSLGLTGGGGSIFAVPLMLYGLGLDLRRAVALSLAVVGLTALYGAILQARSGRLLWGAGAMIGVGGILGAPLGAWAGARLPETLMLLLFAALMVVIGWRMLARREQGAEVPLSWMTCRREPGADAPRFHLPCATKLVTAGALTGLLSGIFGVGGGFLVVPALLIVTGIRLERALATSLIGIFLISVSAFAANARHLSAGDLPVAAWFLGGAGAGMTGGIWLKQFLSEVRLRQFFAGIVFLVAGYIVFRALAG